MGQLEYYDEMLNEFTEFNKEVFIEEFKENIDLRKLKKFDEDKQYIYLKFNEEDLNTPLKNKIEWLGFTFRKLK